MTALDASELRLLHALVDKALAGARSPVWEPVRDKLARMIAEGASAPRWGGVVYAIELPLTLAPTMNRYGSMEAWMQKKLRQQLGQVLQAELHKWPRWRAPGTVRRGVRVTRHTAKRPDELGVDVLGGKVPIDCMVRLGILAGDDGARLERLALWQKASPTRGKLVIEVYELR